jgi:hypothetical protein
LAIGTTVVLQRNCSGIRVPMRDRRARVPNNAIYNCAWNRDSSMAIYHNFIQRLYLEAEDIMSASSHPA